MFPSSESVPSCPRTVAIIGAGRLGGVLARALRAADVEVAGPLGRNEEIREDAIVLLCVPDAAIADAAARARDRATLIGHVSGATGLDDVDFSLHPLQTFTGSEEPDVFHGIGAAVAGRTPKALAVATALAEALGARPFAVDDRAGYHAAASFASNLVLAVLDAAEHIARSAGLDDSRELLAPLVRRTVDNWAEQGAASALTGPISRGDEQTVARQRGAVAAARPELAALFDELVSATRLLASPGGVPRRAEGVSSRSLRSLAGDGSLSERSESKRSEVPGGADCEATTRSLSERSESKRGEVSGGADGVSSRSLRSLAQRPEGVA
ncbi:DUF2520 domain-containing protein [Microbacterium sp. KUDC0406]|uniref:Rossmann-like and DUF2520 domain-containing protein n=1 Tax=Microbacterium sp. KUDC0406 TaxID=2909588 RepID=UPI001F426D57|nr:Rossmann-like and DUF2520 domain-containing protein [Microbacterium sp. KUDC0406]UJP09369.1 DUF2520 domain-containing protein [Microbacterium sp. KUDC0406]